MDNLGRPEKTRINAALSQVAGLFAVATLGGCVSGSPGLGEQAGTAELPTGLTLAASSSAECGDSVHIGAGALSEARLGPELFIRPGQNATFRVNETPVNWACIDDDSREFHELQCTEEADYVRITRAADGEELLLECFG
ncbi:MAG TPA: hypothetical protein VKQ06_07320 [Gammaproteobacteria bacterium]|nr:hypothetical protein [Gammaproteobacteria bacterium]